MNEVPNQMFQREIIPAKVDISSKKDTQAEEIEHLGQQVLKKEPPSIQATRKIKISTVPTKDPEIKDVRIIFEKIMEDCIGSSEGLRRRDKIDIFNTLFKEIEEVYQRPDVDKFSSTLDKLNDYREKYKLQEGGKLSSDHILYDLNNLKKGLEDLFKPTLKWLPSALKLNLQKRHIAYIKKEHEKAVDTKRTTPVLPAVIAIPMDKTQNPIGIVTVPLVIPRSLLTSEITLSFDHIVKVIDNVHTGTTGREREKNLQIKRFLELKNEIKAVYSQTDLSPSKKQEEMFRIIDAYIEKNKHLTQKLISPTAAENLTLIKKNLQNLVSKIEDSQLENFPLKYNTQEILNHLRIGLERLGPENNEKILDFIREMNAIPEHFMDKKEFFEKIDQLIIQKEGISEENTRERAQLDNIINLLIYITTSPKGPNFPKLQEYASSADLETHLVNFPQKKEIISRMAARFADLPEYVIKLGKEGQREELGGVIVEKLGLNSFIAPKTSVSMGGTAIKNIKVKDAIVSRLISEGESLDNHYKLWIDYGAAKQNYTLAKFLNSPEKVLLKYQRKFEELSDKLAELGGRESVGELSTISALTGGFDDHLLQYFLTNKNFMHIDFSRFLTPSVVERNKEIYYNFRSALIDHPFAEDPLPQHVIETIKNWNEKAILESLQEYVGKEERFKEAHDTISSLYEDLSGLDKNENLMAACLKHGIPYDIQEDQRNATIEHLKQVCAQKFNATQKECFAKIHPKAFGEFTKRLHALKEYVDRESSPTAKGAFEEMHPEIVPFFRVLSRAEGSPGETIYFQTVPLSLRSLDSILKKGQTEIGPETLQKMGLDPTIPKKFASEDEIRQMEEILITMRTNPSDRFEELLTSDAVQLLKGQQKPQEKKSEEQNPV